MDALQEWNFEKYTESVSKRALNQNVKHVVKEGARAGKALMINTDQLISTVQVLSVAGGAAKAAQVISITTGVMSALFLALDIFFLAKDSHELRKGAKTQFATKLREVCKELQDGILELNRVKNELQKTMDGIEVEEFEEEEDDDDDDEDYSDLESDPKKLAQLEEEINQMEQKLDQEVREKKGEAEGRKETTINDSKEDHVKPQRGKMEKGEEEVESVKGEGEERVEKGMVETEGQKYEIDQMAKYENEKIKPVEQEKDEKGDEEKKKRTEGDAKGGVDDQGKNVKREGNEQRKKELEDWVDRSKNSEKRGDESGKKESGWGSEQKNEKKHNEERRKDTKREGDEHGKREMRRGDEWRKDAKVECDEQRASGKKEGDERWKDTKREGDERWTSGKREGDERWTSGKREGDERWTSGKREGDEHRTSGKREGDEQRTSRKREGDTQGKREQAIVLNSSTIIPPPARPRSKAISNSTEETRWEEPLTNPKAPPPVPHKKRSSHREPLSI